MSIVKKIKVFFDSSVIIEGLASSRGASCMLLSLAEMEIIEPYISEQVVTEVIKNIEKKLPSCLPQFFTLFKKLPLILVDDEEEKLKYALKIINDRDAKILSAAMTAGVDVLVSLDKHFLDSQLAGKLDFMICAPGELLKEIGGHLTELLLLTTTTQFKD